MSTLNGEIPMPLDNIGCQDLLATEENIYSGWLRKRHFINKLNMFNWPQVYVVLNKGCVYYFRNEYAVKALGKFSLYGYNSVTRSKSITPKQGPWAFQVTHAQAEEFKRYYFSASSEREMKEWMQQVKLQLVEANGKTELYYTYQSGALKRVDNDATYNEIEANIYDDSTKFRLTEDYKKKFKIKGRDEESDEDDDPPENYRKRSDPASRGQLPLPRTPDLPSRGGKTNTATRMPLPDLPSSHSDHSSGHSSLPRLHKLPEVPDTPRKQPARKSNSNPSRSSEDIPPSLPPRKSDPDIDVGRRKYTEGGRKDMTNGRNTSKQETVHSRADDDDDDDDDEEDDGDSYWDSIYWTEKNTERCSEVIKKLGDEGTFLVRPGTNGQVLVVLVDSATKKYQIQQDEKKQYFLKKDGPRGGTVEELMYEYHSTVLPNCKSGTRLTTPFKRHHDYEPGM